MAKKRLSLFIFAICLFGLINGCSVMPVASPTPTPTETPAQESSASMQDNITVIKKDGISIAFPNEYYDSLLFNPKNNFYHVDGALVEVFHKVTYEKAAKGGATAGWLFSIVRYSRAQYEQYLCKGDFSCQSFFAKDEKYYYGYFLPTDIQTTDKRELKLYDEIMQNGGEFVRNDLISRNSLTPYSNSEFFSKPFTYEGEHVFLNYYPYYAYEGSRKAVRRIVLSQPEKKGEKGIWCVERMYEEPNGREPYIYFPNANGLSSAEYYSKLQKDCDAGIRLDLLDPTLVALDYVKLVYGHTAATKDSFDKAEAPQT